MKFLQIEMQDSRMLFDYWLEVVTTWHVRGAICNSQRRTKLIKLRKYFHDHISCDTVDCPINCVEYDEDSWKSNSEDLVEFWLTEVEVILLFGGNVLNVCEFCWKVLWWNQFVRLKRVEAAITDTQSKLTNQSNEHKGHADACVHVYRFGVSSFRDLGGNALTTEGHHEHCHDANCQPKMRSSVVQPKRNPWHDDDHCARNINLREVMTRRPL